MFLVKISLLQPSIIRLGVLLLLFDVYLTWARIEEAMPSSSATDSISMPTPSDPFTHPTSNATGSSDSSASGLFPTSYLLSEQPIILQYVFFLLLCALETIAFHLPIRTLLSLRLPRPLSYLIPHYPHPAVISTALLVSSFTKLFPLLLLIWRYDLPSSASAVSWAVIINNVAALEILLECGVIRAAILAAVGAVCRAGVGWVSPVTNSRLWVRANHTIGHTESCWCGIWCGSCRSRRDRRCTRAVETTRTTRRHSTIAQLQQQKQYTHLRRHQCQKQRAANVKTSPMTSDMFTVYLSRF